jgi:hypothetical protein
VRFQNHNALEGKDCRVLREIIKATKETLVDYNLLELYIFYAIANFPTKINTWKAMQSSVSLFLGKP